MDYFLGQARQHWLKLDCRLSQGHLAVGLKRFGDAEPHHHRSPGGKEHVLHLVGPGGSIVVGQLMALVQRYPPLVDGAFVISFIATSLGICSLVIGAGWLSRIRGAFHGMLLALSVAAFLPLLVVDTRSTS